MSEKTILLEKIKKAESLLLDVIQKRTTAPGPTIEQAERMLKMLLDLREVVRTDRIPPAPRSHEIGFVVTDGWKEDWPVSEVLLDVDFRYHRFGLAR